MIVAQLPEVTAQQDREIEWLAELLGAYCLYEKKQYGDIWTNDEYLQFMYERLMILRELMSDTCLLYTSDAADEL